MNEEPRNRSSFIDKVATGTKQHLVRLRSPALLQILAGGFPVLEVTSVLCMASTGKGTVGSRVVSP